MVKIRAIVRFALKIHCGYSVENELRETRVVMAVWLRVSCCPRM